MSAWTTALQFRSLRVRLLAGTLAGIAAALAITGWGLGNLFRNHVQAQFQAELRLHLDQLTTQLSLDDAGQPTVATPLADPRFVRPLSGVYWQVDRLDPKPATAIARSRSLWDETLALTDDAVRLRGPRGASLGVATRVVEIENQRLRLSVAADESLMMEPVARFHRAMGWALALLGLGLGMAAVLQVALGLAPLRTLHHQLAAIRAGKQERLSGHFPQEVAPLVDDFNAVLEHQAESVLRARTQAGNLAHALKTPLSVLTNAAHALDPELPSIVRTQVDLARRQVDYHLARAQAAARRPSPARCAVTPVIAGLLRVMPRLHAERALDLRHDGTAAQFAGDEQDLQEMLGNLIDNACKWARGRVHISTHADTTHLVIDIDDDGPGIAEDARERLRLRGARADEDIPGSGLGLAIVDDLARAYRGSLNLAVSPLGGLRARLHLPGAPDTGGMLPP